MNKYIEYAKAFNASDEVLNWLNANLANYLKNNEENQQEIEHIIDFLVSDKAPKRLKKMSYDEAQKSTDKWVKSLIKKGSAIAELPEDTELVKDFGDGFKIVKLIGKAAYEREGYLMRHCVASYYGTNKEIYSLRDAENMPHCTMEAGQQIKGKGNGSIHPKYIEYVIAFLEETGMTVDDSEMENLGYVNISAIKQKLHPTKNKLYKDYALQASTFFALDGTEYCEFDLWQYKPLIKDNRINYNLDAFIKKATKNRHHLNCDNSSPSATSGKCSLSATNKYMSPSATSGEYSPSATSGEYSSSATTGKYSSSATTGKYSPSATSGYKSPSATSGEYSSSATSGNFSPSATSGKYSPSATSGDFSPSATSGNRSPSATSGNRSPSATSGNRSPSATSGNHSPSATSGEYSPSATSGKYSPSATSGDFSPSATSGYKSPSATSGYKSPSATSGKCSPSATSGEYSPSATSGNFSPSATSGKCSSSATSGDFSPSATSGKCSPSATSVDFSPSATSGKCSHSATNGYMSPSATSGYRSPVEVNGPHSAGACIGDKGKIKGAEGNPIAICYYVDQKPIRFVTGVIGQNGLKPDTWYKLDAKGEFIECKNS